MVRLIVEIILDPKHGGVFKSCAQAEVRLGRGFDNDIIIDDPYVGAHQAVVSVADGRIRLRDLDPTNGILRGNGGERITEADLASGEEVIMGRTRLRFFLPEHEVAPAKKLREGSKFQRLLTRAYLAWPLLLLAMGNNTLEAFLRTTDNEKLTQLLVFPITIFILSVVWTLFWSFIGRLIRHQFFFHAHLSICALWYLASALLGNINGYLEYYLNSQTLKFVLDYVTSGGLFIAVFYLSLSFASHMQAKSKIITATVVTLLLVISTLGLRFSVQHEYLLGSPFNQSLKPPVLGVPATHSPEFFLERTDKLFTFKNGAHDAS